jgi:hypothetical protein
MPPSRPDTTNRAADRAREVPEGWRRPSHGRGLLKPFPAGNSGRPPNVSSRYSETLALARQHSPDAMKTLIARLNDVDGRIAVMSASIILERAFGKPREMRIDEEKHHIDLSQLNAEEMRIMLALAQSGRLKALPGDGQGEAPPTIDAKPE